MKRYVAGFMFNEQGYAVALVHKNRPEWQAGKLNAIGGHIEEGETPVNAMQREFYEEAGIMYPACLWKPLVRLYRPGAFEVFFYSAHSDLVLAAKTLTDEVVSLIAVAELGKYEVVPSVRWLVPMALDLNINRDKFIEIEDVRGN